MNRLSIAILVMPIAMFCGLTVSAADAEKPEQSNEQTRKLIYCADLMTHEERDAYRERMRAAVSPQERAALREAHRKEMQDRARNRGEDLEACEPRRYRLHKGGSKYENAE